MFVNAPDTRKQERLRALVEDPRRRRFWAARSRRRQAVVALALVTIVASAAFAVSIGVEPPYTPLLMGVFVVFLLGTMVLGTQLNVAARWVVGYEGVDEFQRSEMDRATLLGHHVTAALLALLVAVTCGFGGWSVGGGLPTDVAFMVLVPLVLVTAMCHAVFPACYLAWTRPDEILQEEDEKE
ncbi:hypothetical protein [Nocardiopsis sp. ATB16-24]|uniref:hypothetical protein n=1 Tax=Nocardiopsis sp. ATB16-24 TaxID=3019555 RepID=UPI0025565485|nr:hypothetical protein [Nocardiopsis sp. ATB16-24]